MPTSTARSSRRSSADRQSSRSPPPLPLLLRPPPRPRPPALACASRPRPTPPSARRWACSTAASSTCARRDRDDPKTGGPLNPQKLMKQLQQAQERMQAEIAALVVEASAGGGMVKVTMDGQKSLMSITLDREAVNPDDVEMLQDLILAAVNDASRKVDAAIQDKIGGLTGGLKIPGLG